MTDQPPSPANHFFRKAFAGTGRHPTREDELLTQLRTQWDALSGRVFPNPSRPDHALMHFFQFAQELDRWVREWGAVADQENSERLRATLGEARQSLNSLVAEGKAVFEQQRAHRVAQQQTQDQQRWLQEQRRIERAQSQAEHERRRAEAAAKLKQTHQEINEIYQGIRQNQARSTERNNAMWRAAHFPDTTCACGKSKLSNQPCCFDCANRGGRTFWY